MESLNRMGEAFIIAFSIDVQQYKYLSHSPVKLYKTLSFVIEIRTSIA